VGRDLEHEVVPFVQDAGIGVMVWGPLASGFLSGKYTRDNPAPEGTRRSRFAFPPVDVERGYDVVDALREVAAARGATPAQVALAWLLTCPFVSTVIVGASRMSQLEENLAAAGLVLGEEEVRRLDQLTAPAAIYPNYMAQAMAWDAKVKEALGR
jgi:aryl-alcohol dehydrogenase-like predicted oxidoreductase